MGFESQKIQWNFEELIKCFRDVLMSIKKFTDICHDHSPAFISVDNSRCSLFRAIKVGGNTAITNVDQARTSGVDDLTLAEELGHISLMSQLHQLMEQKIAEAEEAKAYTERLEAQAVQLEARIAQFSKPVVVTEENRCLNTLDSLGKAVSWPRASIRHHIMRYHREFNHGRQRWCRNS